MCVWECLCVCVCTDRDTKGAISCITFQTVTETWQRNQEPTLYAGSNSGCHSINMAEVVLLWLLAFMSDTGTKGKNNTSYNRLEKNNKHSLCVSYNRSHSVCLWQERTDLPTDWLNGWLKLFFLLKREKIWAILKKKLDLHLFFIHTLSLFFLSAVSYCNSFFFSYYAHPWVCYSPHDKEVGSFHTSSRSRAHNYRSFAHNAPVNEY